MLYKSELESLKSAVLGWIKMQIEISKERVDCQIYHDAGANTLTICIGIQQNAAIAEHVGKAILTLTARRLGSFSVGKITLKITASQSANQEWNTETTPIAYWAPAKTMSSLMMN